MACHLFGAKSLSKPVMASYQSQPKEKDFNKKLSKLTHFIDKMVFKFIVCIFAAIFTKWAEFKKWYKCYFELNKDKAYLSHDGRAMGVYFGYFWEKWPSYKETKMTVL